MESSNLKFCNSCQQWKNTNKFSKSCRTRDGLQSQCKDCVNRKYREKHPLPPEPKTGYKICVKCKQEKLLTDFVRNSMKPNDYGSYCKKCHNMRFQSEEYKKKKAEYDKQYYKDNHERIKQNVKIFKDNNKDLVLLWRNNYRDVRNKRRNLRRSTDIRYRLDENMGSTICHALKGNKNFISWKLLLPYSVEDLILHLESQFTPGMNWDNYGSYWEIDHIIPKNLFKYDKPEDEQFKICWSLSNLRPLEKTINKSRPRNGSDISNELKYKILNNSNNTHTRS